MIWTDPEKYTKQAGVASELCTQQSGILEHTVQLHKMGLADMAEKVGTAAPKECSSEGHASIRAAAIAAVGGMGATHP